MGSAGTAWPPSEGVTRAFVLVNESAGGVGAGARDKLLSILADAGVKDIDLRQEIRDLGSCRRRARAAQVAIILGGDGTARAAAEALEGGPPLIILPGGTLNVLPHALYGDRTWPEALREALGSGRIRKLVGGKANGKRFYVAGLFGPPTLLARAREAVREGRPVTAWRRLRHALSRMFAQDVEVRVGGAPYRRVEAVGVLCPAYVGEIEDDTLEWVRLDVTRMADLARVGLRAVVGGWRDDETIDLTRATGGFVRSPGVIPATLDGEPTAFVSRVKIEMVRNGPRVIALH